MNNTICHVCLGTDVNYCFEDSRIWKYYENDYKLNQCLSCQSVFTNPLPSNNTVRKIYINNFNYQWYKDYYEAKYKDCLIRLEEYSEFIENKSILDFGGGIGYLSEAARNRGYKSETYDPYCSESDILKGKKWDVVIALHVLEHSNNLDEFIENIKSLLKADGTLIIAVPNFLSNGYKQLGMDWVWAQPPLVHIFHFTCKGLTSLLERHGFSIQNISYHDRWDANFEADLNQVTKFRKLDKDWGRKPFNLFSSYRKFISRRNSKIRFGALEKSKSIDNDNIELLSELQIVAKYL